MCFIWRKERKQWHRSGCHFERGVAIALFILHFAAPAGPFWSQNGFINTLQGPEVSIFNVHLKWSATCIGHSNGWPCIAHHERLSLAPKTQNNLHRNHGRIWSTKKQKIHTHFQPQSSPSKPSNIAMSAVTVFSSPKNWPEQPVPPKIVLALEKNGM